VPSFDSLFMGKLQLLEYFQAISDDACVHPLRFVSYFITEIF